jgi:hypothetical protein
LRNASGKDFVQDKAELLSSQLLSYNKEVLTEPRAVSTAVDLMVVKVVNTVLLQLNRVYEEFLFEVTTFYVKHAKFDRFTVSTPDVKILKSSHRAQKYWLPGVAR